MNDLVPCFPLGLVAFPGETVNLHIFEPRYRQLISDCVDGDLSFAIPFYKEGDELSLGTLMKVKSIVKRYADGKMDVSTLALHPCYLVHFQNTYPGKLYPGGKLKILSWKGKSDLTLSQEIIFLVSKLYKLMNITNVELKPPADLYMYQIAHKVGLNKGQELELLLIEKEVDRQIFIRDHLLNFIPLATQMEEMRKRAELNGYFKNIVPPTI